MRFIRTTIDELQPWHSDIKLLDGMIVHNIIICMSYVLFLYYAAMDMFAITLWVCGCFNLYYSFRSHESFKNNYSLTYVLKLSIFVILLYFDKKKILWTCMGWSSLICRFCHRILKLICSSITVHSLPHTSVLGRHGTAVGTYFRLLRWVLIMNILGAILWAAFVIIPVLVQYTSLIIWS